MKESQFDGGLLGLIGVSILAGLLTCVTFGIAFPWAICIKQRWYAKHTYIDGNQLVFDGKGSQLFGNYIKWLLLTIITLGIYSFWLGIKMQKWVTKHTHFVTEEI